LSAATRSRPRASSMATRLRRARSNPVGAITSARAARSRATLKLPAPWPHGLTSPDVESSVNLACFAPIAVEAYMDRSELLALSLRGAALGARRSALSAENIEIRQESRAAMATSKVRVARTLIERTRLREPLRIVLTSRSRRTASADLASL
jgi:hypothetical protein